VFFHVLGRSRLTADAGLSERAAETILFPFFAFGSFKNSTPPKSCQVKGRTFFKRFSPIHWLFGQAA
jgi:hypothetical protein